MNIKKEKRINKSSKNNIRVKRNRNNNRNINKNIGTEYFYCFLSNFDISNSIWVLYLVFKGFSLWQIGIVEGIYHVTSFLFEIPTGAFADLLGRKKTIIIGRICNMLSAFLCLFGYQMWHFAAAFAISAVGRNMNSGSEEALLYDSMKQLGQEEKYIKVSSRRNILIEIAQGIAIVSGGMIAEQSFSWCYILSVIIALLSLLPALLFMEPEFDKEADKEERKKEKKPFGLLADHFKICITIIRKEDKLRRLLMFYPVVFTFHTMIYFYGQEFFSLMGLNKIEISMIMLLAGLFSVIGAMSSELLLLRFGLRTKYAAAAAIALGILFLSGHNLIVSVIAFAFANYANSFLYPIQSLELNKLIPSGQRATILSVDSMIFSFLMLVLFPAGGFIADITNLHLMFLLMGMLLLLLLFLLYMIKRLKTKFSDET